MLTTTGRKRITRLAGTIVTTLLLGLVFERATASAARSDLTRYPYLTDAVMVKGVGHVTINWATDRSQNEAFVLYRRYDQGALRRVDARRSAIVVHGKAAYQWRATLTGLSPETRYDYRVYSPPMTDLLGRWRDFTTLPAPGSTTSYSFAVLGDWGAAVTPAHLRAQARLHSLIAAGPARFVISVGDAAYPRGTQTSYGDLHEKGVNVSEVFAPRMYPRVGVNRPMFAAPGNHGMTWPLLKVWPQSSAVSSSNGRYQMDTYSLEGTRTRRYPSVWYAFTVGQARYYILTSAWPNSNQGTGTLYSNDYRAHWKPGSAQYRWLKRDLATHPTPLKFATFHFPMYSDNAFEDSDRHLHGKGSLAELLTDYGVQVVFNGHARIYERNRRQPGESFVSYVLGAGGKLERVGPSSPFDAYGIGWSASLSRGFATGSAPLPRSAEEVYSFLLVTVKGTTVTTEGVNALGESFDKVTYRF